MATSYTSDDRAAMANSYSGNQTAVMASYRQQLPRRNGRVVLFRQPHGGGDLDINACTNLPSTSSGFTQGLPPLPPPQFFWTEQQLTFTAQDKSMIGCNSGSDLLWQAIRNNLARCNLLQEYFTVAHSTLDHTGRDRITNTVPVHQSVNDPHCTIRHKNYLEHPGENGGSDCAAIMGPEMKPGGRSHNGRMLPTENPMDTEFLSYMESVNFTSTPRVDDGDLIMTPMQASSGGDGRPGAYYPSAQFGVGSSDQSRGVDGGNLSGR
ncbi:hypothetical protein Ancab_000604 [Ancistrocladus abbreviatus]